MNINIKQQLYTHLLKILGKNVSSKIPSTSQSVVALHRKTSPHRLENHKQKTCNIIYFEKKRTPSSLLRRLLDHHVLRLVIGVGVILLIMLGMSFGNAEKPTGNFVDIQVRSGDTVWSIAAQYCTNKADLREMVYSIKTLNGLDQNALIHTGQILRVPTYNHSATDIVPRPQQ